VNNVLNALQTRLITLLGGLHALVYSYAAGDTINKHFLDKPPTSTQKLTLRVSRNDIISGAVAATLPMFFDQCQRGVLSLMTTILAGRMFAWTR
jgi:hypothetical protein